jgi:ribosome-associated toxin RatA of RatAB toxin-antitoxin module
MATLRNEITIHAPVGKVWEALSNVEELEKYDPTVKSSVALSSLKQGVNASRKVDMKDGKNWFEEKCTMWEPNEAIVYELTACSFPVHKLKHSYRFEVKNDSVRVSQVMEYQIKFGFIGRVLDAIMVRKQSDNGVKKFFAGLKSYLEQSPNQ